MRCTARLPSESTLEVDNHEIVFYADDENLYKVIKNPSDCHVLYHALNQLNTNWHSLPIPENLKCFRFIKPEN